MPAGIVPVELGAVALPLAPESDPTMVLP